MLLVQETWSPMMIMIADDVFDEGSRVACGLQYATYWTLEPRQHLRAVNTFLHVRPWKMSAGGPLNSRN